MILPTKEEISKKLGDKLSGDVIRKEDFITFLMNAEIGVVMVKMKSTPDSYNIKVYFPKGLPPMIRHVFNLNWSQWLDELDLYVADEEEKMLTKRCQIDKVASVLESSGISILRFPHPEKYHWNLSGDDVLIGVLKFDFRTESYLYTRHRGISEEGLINLVSSAIHLPTDDHLWESVEGSVVRVWINTKGEVIFTNNDKTFRLYEGNIAKGTKIIRVAIRLFNKIKRPGIWCSAEDTDGLKDRRLSFFEKIGFTKGENGFLYYH